LAEFKKKIASFERLNTRILALSVDAPKQSQAVVRNLDLPFDLLCDVDKHVIDLYHLRNPHEHGGIAYPAIFVIAPSGKVHYRSLDGTAQRVDLSDMLTFLEDFNDNPEYVSQEKPKKRWIIPLWNEMWQISRNMVLRGNTADWKHYFMFPVSMLKISGRKVTGMFKRTQ